MIMIFGLLNMETTCFKSCSISTTSQSICLESRPIFVSVAKQAFSAVGVGIRPKSIAVWAVLRREKRSFQANKNQPGPFGTFGASKVQHRKIKADIESMLPVK